MIPVVEPKKKHWEHFAHGADIGVRGFGHSKEEAFEQIAMAMMHVITNANIEPKDAIEVSCEAPDDEMLLVDWLNGLVFEMSTWNMLFSRFKVTFSGHKLYGQAWGEKVDVAKHRPAVEVKGATYTELKVTKDEKGLWCVQCVVDV